MSPQYFALRSRLGLQHAPVGSTELNIGVEDGSRTILTPEFLQKLPGTVTEYTFPIPQLTSKYWELVREHTFAASHLIASHLKTTESQVVIGGDHSVTFASLHALSKRIDLRNVAYIQIDSHPDLNTIKSSPSGNFHGMYVRAAVAEIGVAEVDSCFLQKLPPQNIWYFGNLSFDPNPEERNFLQTHKIPCISVMDWRKNYTTIQTQLRAFLQNYTHLHISFDIDCMDKTIAAATGIPCPDGFLMHDIELLLTTLISNELPISFDLVEVNPAKTGAQQTIKTAQEILEIVQR
mgnify:CR=1 FL=1